MKLKISKIRELYSALLSLDGYSKIVKLNGEEQVVKVPFNFSGKTRWNIAKNIRILRSSVETYNEEQDRLIKEVSGGKTRIDEKEVDLFNQFNLKIADILAIEEDISGLLRFKASDLVKDGENENPISAGVLAVLGDLIDE